MFALLRCCDDANSIQFGDLGRLSLVMLVYGLCSHHSKRLGVNLVLFHRVTTTMRHAMQGQVDAKKMARHICCHSASSEAHIRQYVLQIKHITP